MRARFLRPVVAAALAVGATVLAPVADRPPPAMAATSLVSFQAGTHTGYQFSSSGQVVATKSVALSRASAAHASARTVIAGQGTFLAIVDGIWAGYYVRESPVAYIPGSTASTTYNPPVWVSFPAGTVVGYRFDASWQMTSAKIGMLARTSQAHAGQRAVINGTTYYRIVDGGWAGTWVPVASGGGVKALACRTGPRATGGAQLLTNVAGAGPEVALTFDMGGRLDPALGIMRYLLLTGTCTTIFPTGANSPTTIGAQVLAMVKAYPQVFEVGNHTMNHCHWVLGGDGPNCPTTRMTDAQARQELTSAASIILYGSGQNPVPYWRPPYGEQDARARSVAASVGYTKTVMWDLDTIDWRAVTDTPAGPTTTAIIGKVVTGARNGSIVLMHLGGWNTSAALPMMIHQLRTSRGLTPTTVSDLLDLS